MLSGTSVLSESPTGFVTENNLNGGGGVCVCVCEGVFLYLFRTKYTRTDTVSLYFVQWHLINGNVSGVDVLSPLELCV